MALYLKDRLKPDDTLTHMASMSDVDSEVLAALTTLGYSVVEAQSAIQSIPKDAAAGCGGPSPPGVAKFRIRNFSPPPGGLFVGDCWLKNIPLHARIDETIEVQFMEETNQQYATVE